MFFRMREIKIHKDTFLAFVTLAKRQIDRNGQSSQMLGYLIGYELQEENYCVGTELVLPNQNSHLQSTVLRGMYRSIGINNHTVINNIFKQNQSIRLNNQYEQKYWRL